MVVVALLAGCTAAAQPTPPTLAPPTLAPAAPIQVVGVLANVPAGRQTWWTAVSERFRRAYVTNREDGTLTMVDLETNRAIGSPRVGEDPHNVAVDDAAGRVYVTLHGAFGVRADQVAVVDPLSGEVLATWPTGPFPASLDYHHDLGRLYVVNEGDSSLSVLDTDSGATIARVPMPGNAMDVAVSGPSRRVYVVSWIANVLVVLDAESLAVLAQVPIGTLPLRVAVNPVTERVYVADGKQPGEQQGSLWTIDGRSYAVSSRELGGFPLGVSTAPDVDEVLVTDAQRGTLAVLDGAGQQVKWHAVVGSAPHTVVASRALGRLYLVLGGSNSLGVLSWPLPALGP